MDSKDQLVNRELRVLQDCRATRVQQDSKGQVASQALQDNREPRDLQEYQVHREPLAHRVLVAQQDLQEQKVPPELQVAVELKGLWELLELQDRLDLLVRYQYGVTSTLLCHL